MLELTSVAGFAQTSQNEDEILKRGAAFWPSIQNILASLGPQALESLQRTLALQRTYTLTADELRIVLERAAAEGTVARLVDGRWLLPQ